MPKAERSKVTRNKVVHPNSRYASKLVKQRHHDNRVERRLTEKSQRLDILGEKLKWFRDNIDKEKAAYTTEEVTSLIEKYLSRFEDELEQISIINSMKGRRGQQHAGRLNAINFTLERDNREYTTNGLEIPDLINSKNFEILKKWNGEMRYVPNIRMKKVKKSFETGHFPDSSLPSNDKPETENRSSDNSRDQDYSVPEVADGDVAMNSNDI